MDMDGMGLTSESFDIVTNQESFCCTQHKREYLQEVYRLLVPGGAWSSIDFNVRAGELSSTEGEEVQRVLRGFHIPSLLSLSEILNYARDAGFEACRAEELGDAVLPTAAIIMRTSREPILRARRCPDEFIHSPFPTEEANVRGHFEAGMAYSIGLHTGLFEHGFFRCFKPVA
jgi:SAM-dependent methyltransferase